MNNSNTLTEFLNPVFENEIIKKFSLQEKSAKILMRFVEQKDKYLSLAAAKKNFVRITSQDAIIIVGQLEKMGYLLGNYERGRLVYKFNDSQQRTSLTIPLNKIEEAQQRFNERIAKKVERAAQTIERYKNLGQIVQIVEKKSKDQADCDTIQLEKDFISNTKKKEDFYVSTPLSKKSAKELHEDKECDSKTCRFCAIEQDKVIGF